MEAQRDRGKTSKLTTQLVNELNKNDKLSSIVFNNLNCTDVLGCVLDVLLQLRAKVQVGIVSAEPQRSEFLVVFVLLCHHLNVIIETSDLLILLLSMLPKLGMSLLDICHEFLKLLAHQVISSFHMERVVIRFALIAWYNRDGNTLPHRWLRKRNARRGLY